MPNITMALMPYPNNNQNADIEELLNRLRIPTVNLNTVLNRARKYLSKYCLHYGEVRNVMHQDTGVVIGLIVYFIANEPTINRTKLEAYILLLNTICALAYGKTFFSCSLNTNGRIGNFKKFIDDMKVQELIIHQENNTYGLCTNSSWIIAHSTNIFDGIVNILTGILGTWGHKNGRQTLEDALSLMGYHVYSPRQDEIAQMLEDDMKRRAQGIENIINVEIDENNEDKHNGSNIIPKQNN